MSDEPTTRPAPVDDRAVQRQPAGPHGHVQLPRRQARNPRLDDNAADDERDDHDARNGEREAAAQRERKRHSQQRERRSPAWPARRRSGPVAAARRSCTGRRAPRRPGRRRGASPPPWGDAAASPTHALHELAHPLDGIREHRRRSSPAKQIGLCRTDELGAVANPTLGRAGKGPCGRRQRSLASAESKATNSNRR